MAFLEINGVPVPCVLGAQSQATPRLIGDRLTSFSGRTRSTVRGHIRTWSLVTPPIPLADARALELILASPYPVTCGGELFDGMPTACIAQLSAIRHNKYADGERAVVEFTLTDADPYSPLLFWCSAGRPLPVGTTFSRASSAWYFDRDGILREAAANVLRTEWLDLDGDGHRETPALLLEPQRTNQIRNPRCEGAVVGVVGSGGALPTHWGVDTVGGLTWEVVGTGVEDGLPYVDLRAHGTPTGTISQIRLETYTGITAAPGQTWTGSLYVRRVGGSMDGVGRVRVGVQERADGTFLADTVVTVDAEAARLSDARAVCTRTASNAATTHALLVAGLGGLTPGVPVDSTLRIAGPQMEQSPVASSLVLPPSGAPAASARSADLLTAAYTAPPQAMAVYARFEERGGVLSDAFANLVMVGSGGNRLQIQTDSAVHCYQIRYSSGGTNRFATLGAAPEIGDAVELLLTLTEDGTATLYQSIGGDAATSISAAALALPVAWGAETITIGGGEHAFRDLVVLRGASWTMDAARRLVG